jgi:hypothetical protein
MTMGRNKDRKTKEEEERGEIRSIKLNTRIKKKVVSDK